MRRWIDASRPGGFDAFARGLQSTFPARGDAPRAAFELGCRAVTPLLNPVASTLMEVRR